MTEINSQETVTCDLTHRLATTSCCCLETESGALGKTSVAEESRPQTGYHCGVGLALSEPSAPGAR